MKHYVLLPLRPAPLILVALFSAGLRLALLAGMMGIALAAILVSWFFKYCFVLLDSAVAGDDEPPVLSVEMVNPLNEQRPLAQALIIAAGGAVAGLAGTVAGPFGLALSGALLLAALPATVAVLGVSGNPFYAASPVALFALVRGLGRDYARLVAAALGLGAGLYTLVRLDAPLGLTLPLAQLAFLMIFALIGGAVHENRLALGISTRTREERRAEQDLRDHVSERNRMLDDSFAQLRLGRTADAWREIERWVDSHCRGEREDEEFAALLHSTTRWEPPTIADRLAGEYISRLLAHRDGGKALEVLERRLASNPRFRPVQPAVSRRLRELAGFAGKRALCRQLDSDG